MTKENGSSELRKMARNNKTDKHVGVVAPQSEPKEEWYKNWVVALVAGIVIGILITIIAII